MRAVFRIFLGLLSLSLVLTAARGEAASASSVLSSRRLTLVETGSVGDGKTINTEKIQAAIDRLAKAGGGTLVVPSGTFLSGALFLKPGVNLHLEKDGVLKCPTDMKYFPPRRTRIEGHFEEHFNPALINADGCDGLEITGEGVLDGSGRPIWDLFWKMRESAPDRMNFKNLSVPRARLCLIENSRHVKVQGVQFKDSQYWNLHLYHCEDVVVEGSSFAIPDDYRQAPSSDGIDVDSCQTVTIKGCRFSITDDSIALKGSKGPFATQDKSSPPVEHIRVIDCVFRRGHAVVTLGSEATIIRDVVVENCQVLSAMSVLSFKLRPDTLQHYEDIHYRDITVDAAGGALIAVGPWRQYADLQGQPPPTSVVRNVTVSNIKGRFGAFGTLKGNPNQTDISDVTLENIDVNLKNPKLETQGVTNFVVKNVVINGSAIAAPTSE